MRSKDTSVRAAAIQEELQNSLSVEDRIRLALQYSDFVREFAKAALRKLHPNLTEREIGLELIRQLHGIIPTQTK